MSRFDPLKNWPKRLEVMTLGELKRERSYWRMRADHLGHAQARKTTLARARTVDKVIARRFPEES